MAQMRLITAIHAFLAPTAKREHPLSQAFVMQGMSALVETLCQTQAAPSYSLLTPILVHVQQDTSAQLDQAIQFHARQASTSHWKANQSALNAPRASTAVTQALLNQPVTAMRATIAELAQFLPCHMTMSWDASAILETTVPVVLSTSAQVARTLQ